MKIFRIGAIALILVFAAQSNKAFSENRLTNFFSHVRKSLPSMNGIANIANQAKSVVINNPYISVSVGAISVVGTFWYFRRRFSRNTSIKHDHVKTSSYSKEEKDNNGKPITKITKADQAKMTETQDDNNTPDAIPRTRVIETEKVIQKISPVSKREDEFNSIADEYKEFPQTINIMNDSGQALEFEVSGVDGSPIHQATISNNTQDQIIIK